MGDLLIQLLTQFGLPTTMLIGLAWYHVKVVGRKDAEISRINDLRVKEQQAGTDRLLGITQEFNALQGDANKSLDLIAERLRG